MEQVFQVENNDGRNARGRRIGGVYPPPEMFLCGRMRALLIVPRSNRSTAQMDSLG
jgi:hypothetical protein